jgi:hypothetical protein
MALEGAMLHAKHRKTGFKADPSSLKLMPPRSTAVRVYTHMHLYARKVHAKLPGRRNSNSHGVRPVHPTISKIKWIRTSRLSTKNSLSVLLYSPQSSPLFWS